jgi:hypothetical protein
MTREELHRLRRFLRIKYPDATKADVGSIRTNRMIHFVVWTRQGERYAFGCLSTQSQEYLSSARRKQLDLSKAEHLVEATCRIENVSCRLCILKIQSEIDHLL